MIWSNLRKGDKAIIRSDGHSWEGFVREVTKDLVDLRVKVKTENGIVDCVMRFNGALIAGAAVLKHTDPRYGKN